MRISTLLGATRPAFLSMTLVGVILGLSTAKADGVFNAPVLAGITLLFALIAHAGANVLNDYYDALSGCDAANVERIAPFTGGSRFIQNGLLSTQQTAIFGYALLITVMPAGIYLVAESGPGLIAIGLCGLFAGWAYSAQPFKLQSRGFGEITITIAWMMIVIGSDYVQRGSFALTPFITGFAYGLLVANVLFINQIPDITADASAGKKTTIVRFGTTFAPLGSTCFYVSSTATLLIGVCIKSLPHKSLVTLLFWVPATFALHKLYRSANDKISLRFVIQLTITSTLMAGLLVSVSLLT